MKSHLKKNNCYRITIKEINTDNEDSPASLQFEVQDRENLFAIVDQLKRSSGLNEQAATQVGVGIRLLGPVMMQDRKHPLFVDFMPYFKTFMQHLKNTIKSN
ncbi:MAG: DUF3861 domain-containing protein [Psychromonas sp.]|jgi:hypothetical protein